MKRNAAVLDRPARPETARMYRRILLATDFSEVSRNAMAVAAVLARRFGSHLIVANVVPPLPNAIAPPESMYACVDVEKLARTDLENMLDSPFFSGIPTTTRLRTGAPAVELLDLAEIEHADLIVMGTHGEKGLGRLLLGSVAEDVCRNAKCPVITVGPGVKDYHKLMPRGIKRIVYSSDLSPESFAALPHVMAVAAENGSAITMVHVLPIETGTNAEVMVLVKPLLDIMRRNVSRFDLDVDIDFVVDFGSPADTIMRYAREQDAGLIAMGVKQSIGIATHLPGNVAYKVMAGASCPVLTVREG
jgi:nucleotide-binding universal stress UspA family protein